METAFPRAVKSLDATAAIVGTGAEFAELENKHHAMGYRNAVATSSSIQILMCWIHKELIK